MAAPGTWFRFMTKHVSASFVAVKPPYHWHEMDFFTRWTSHGRLETICFNTPASVKSQVQVTLLQRTDTSTDDCYAYIALLVNEVVKLYDQSVWLIRDHIRSVEQDRVNHLTSSVDYHYLHDIARHACHSSETLTTAQDVMAAIISQHDDFWLRRGHITNQDKANHKQTNQKLLFQSHMLRAFRSRSLANESRLQNQINLEFHLASQRDSRVTASIAKAARNDSAAMKAISTLTMVFLLATFTAAIFSTSFFNFTPANQDQQAAWVVAKDFWIYWAVSIPLTAATMVLWFVWQQRYTRPV